MRRNWIYNIKDGTSALLDTREDITNVFVRKFERLYSSEEMEAIRFAFQASSKSDFSTRSIESDSALAISSVTGSATNCPWSLRNIKMDCDRLSPKSSRSQTSPDLIDRVTLRAIT
ncbi:hypothetical protein L484_011574 [Morus notabilis]|uniref:Uncharacterized protein n=1 Tax=Morus notabilis TaxID=981085 RepID=W9RZ75_9ROSA|nr:hypothetical protein L484_011574 [Morus notabilis]